MTYTTTNPNPMTELSGKPAQEARGDQPVSTYNQILHSSILIAGSSVINVVTGIVRSKTIAVFLGPAGVGLMALYTSIVTLTENIAGMGVNGSGVRQIAAAVGTGDNDRIARTALVLRRVSLFLGLLGACVLLMLSRPVSKLTFDDAQHTMAIAFLSVAVLIRVVTNGQTALLQGLRRISDLAKVGILGTVFGSAVTIALIYTFHEQGVIPALVAMAFLPLGFTSWYSRRLHLTKIQPAAWKPWGDVRALLSLGVAFMASSILMTAAEYAVRLIIVRALGVEAAGLYQAAWTMGSVYVGFILQSMVADFYPRLTAVVKNRDECNRIVNEQAQVSMLIAGPGVMATLTFAPFVVPVFYSTEFEGAATLLRWLCLGATMRVITWPMGFIIMADGRQTLFFIVEVAYAAFYVASAVFAVQYLGLDGAGVAFLASYIFHAMLIYPVVRKLSRFTWSRANTRLIVLFLLQIAVVFSSLCLFPPVIGMIVSTLVLTANTVHSTATLLQLVSNDAVPAAMKRLVPFIQARR